MKKGLYETIEETKLYCPDQLVDAVGYIEDIIDYDIETGGPREDIYLNLYTAIYTYMEFGELYNKQMMSSNKFNDYNYDSLVSYFLPQHYSANEEATSLSSLLHIMHNQFPDLHNYAVQEAYYIKSKVMNELGIEKNINDYERIVLFEPLEHLTGKSAFPEWLGELVDRKLENIIDDLSIDKSVTWCYSHLDCGIDYDYSKDEHPQVTIHSLYKNSLEMAEEILNNITLEEMQEYKQNYGNNLQTEEPLQESDLPSDNNENEEEPEEYYDDGTPFNYGSDIEYEDDSEYEEEVEKEDGIATNNNEDEEEEFEEYYDDGTPFNYGSDVEYEYDSEYEEEDNASPNNNESEEEEKEEEEFEEYYDDGTPFNYGSDVEYEYDSEYEEEEENNTLQNNEEQYDEFEEDMSL